MRGMLGENSSLLTVRRTVWLASGLMSIAPTPSARPAPLDRGQASFGYLHSVSYRDGGSTLSVGEATHATMTG